MNLNEHAAILDDDELRGDEVDCEIGQDNSVEECAESDEFAWQNGNGTEQKGFDISRNIYLKEVYKIPLLSREEEKTLGSTIRECALETQYIENNIKRWKLNKIRKEKLLQKLVNIQQRSEAAVNTLMQHNQRLVIEFTKRRGYFFLPNGMDFVQEANLGLMHAAKKYDPTHWKFSTYAVWWINQAMQRYNQNNSKEIRLSVHVREKMYKLRNAKDEMTQRNGRAPSIEGLARELDWSKDEVLFLNEIPYVATSIDRNIETNESSEAQLKDFLPNTNTLNPEQILEAKNLLKIQLPQIHRRLIALGPKTKNRDIYFRRCIKEKPELLEEIGDSYELTRERIRQIVKQIHDKLRIRNHEKQCIKKMNHIRNLADIVKVHDPALGV